MDVFIPVITDSAGGECFLSDRVPVVSRVPQGTVLVSLLFQMFIDDLLKGLQTMTYFSIF